MPAVIMTLLFCDLETCLPSLLGTAHINLPQGIELKISGHIIAWWNDTLMETFLRIIICCLNKPDTTVC